MPLTPADVATKKFSTKRMGTGYDQVEVDGFLDDIEAEIARLLTENAALTSKLAEVQAAPPAAVPAPFEPVPAAVAAPVADAAPMPGETQEAALRTLLMAQRTADQAVAEARAEADKMVSDARTRSSQVENEVNARTTAALAELEGRRHEFESRIEDLRAFEREYRLRLKAYLESQLSDLTRRGGGAEDSGAGVPATARATAVGVMPAGIADRGAARPAAPAAPTPVATPAPIPVAPATPAPAIPAPPATPAPPHLGVPASFVPASVAAPQAPAPAAPTVAVAPAEQPAPAAPRPAVPTASEGLPQVLPPEWAELNQADDSRHSLPRLAPNGPSGPPREASAAAIPPPLRAVPPLSREPEPMGPFTVFPPPVVLEQVDEGPEPPAQS